MHPQLDKNRFDTCNKLMDALEECHKQEFLKQCLGMCNFEKDQLQKCLHYTRINDSKLRIKESRIKQKKIDDIARRREEEVFGKGGYLRKVLEYENNQK
ncbi:uncharacterized protein KGF55_005130 [Candida pseudojiufengensis]|uniref:uncharacterized protein n=1 Tax=Candida pseudojiufengensis TaxID=497109 RepID=UPI0022246882|nr:uncharacterized protein KGF55_005130 [Candida pseudojiufengensis]KAI5959898.1 hypothetical protein KGF55_005130 [Candida pseudojiufengensis]